MTNGRFVLGKMDSSTFNNRQEYVNCVSSLFRGMVFYWGGGLDNIIGCVISVRGARKWNTWLAVFSENQHTTGYNALSRV